MKPARPPRQAWLAERFEWHYTPKHGSWLNMAESGLGVLASHCLDHHIPDKQALSQEMAAWQDRRNNHHTKGQLVLHNRPYSHQAQAPLFSV